MTTWRVKKILVIAQEVGGDCERTLELEKADLDRYTGLFWNPNYDHLKLIYDQQQKPHPAHLAVARGTGTEAIMIKDPNCELTPWPT